MLGHCFALQYCLALQSSKCSSGEGGCEMAD